MAKNNNTLVFNGLMQGMSWDLIKEAKEEIQRHLEEKLPTRKDILTDWIIGKDYMLQLQGNSYQSGGSFNLNPNNLGLYSLQNGNNNNNNNNNTGINFNTENPSTNTSTGGSDFINTASQIGGFIGMFDQLGGNIYLGASQNYAGFSNDPYKKAILGDSSRGMLAGLVSRKSELNNALDDINSLVQQFNIGDNASLMSLWNTYIPLKESTGDAELVDIFGTLVAPGMYNLFGSAKENQEAINLAVKNANARNIANFNAAANNNQLLNTFSQLQHMTKNGGKLKKSHKFAEGGLLNTYDYGLEEVNAGGSHEENPNEGVIVSYAPDGLPNKVEEGETIHNDYVYSKRLEANEKVLKNNLLDKKYEGKSFADISKKLTEDRKKRPNDPISVRTNEENLNRLQDAQEELKLDNKTREVKKFLGSLNNDLLNALQLEMMDEYEAYAELLAQQLEQEDLAYQEEQIALEGMFGRGGHLNQEGNLMKTAADTYFYITHPNALKREYNKQNEQFNNTSYGQIISRPMLDYNNYKNIISKAIDRGIDFVNNIKENQELRLFENDVIEPLIEKNMKEAGIPTKKENRQQKIKNAVDNYQNMWSPPDFIGMFNKRGHSKQGVYGSSYLEREPWYAEPTIVSTWSNPLNIENKIFELSNPINLEPFGIYERDAKGEIKKSKEGKPIIKDEYKKSKGNSSLAPLRFAEAFGSAGLYLSDILGLTNQPDYSNARMYQRAIDNIGGVNFTPIGNYLTYTPIDTEYLANQQMATAAARRNYGNIIGNYTLGLLNDYNILNQIGATAIAARQQDLEQKSKVAEFNRTTNARNSEMSLDAQKQNAALRALKALEYRYLADMMTKERDINEAARAANYQNFMSNLAAIGREDFNYDQIKWMIDHGVFPVGAESYLTGLKI